MIVHLYTLCWNEADMLPFFFRHYDPWVDHYFIYDDGSDDGSLEILRAHPKVTVRRFERTVEGAFALSQKELQSHAWKSSREVADWVVITALDEHIFVRGQPMRRYLQRQRLLGVTYVPALGFDTITDALPDGDIRLVDAATRGVPSVGFNKLSLFNPNAIQSAGYTAGRHSAAPTGQLTRPRQNDLLLYHFKHIGYERTRDRQRAEGARLGPVDVKLRLGVQYLWDEDQFRQHWQTMLSDSIDLGSLPRDATEVAKGPFWWTSIGNAELLVQRAWKRLLRFMRIG
jgi:hypothetical protein